MKIVNLSILGFAMVCLTGLSQAALLCPSPSEMKFETASGKLYAPSGWCWGLNDGSTTLCAQYIRHPKPEFIGAVYTQDLPGQLDQRALCYYGPTNNPQHVLYSKQMINTPPTPSATWRCDFVILSGKCMPLGWHCQSNNPNACAFN